ncbi:MAG TPA: amidohydrolase family protein [Rhodanobacter sp.]|nr:amidohydrolase family protein [Rhodanobacter sp.]
MIHRLSLAGLILLLLTAPAAAASLALTHATVIDGTGAPARADMTIVINGNEIESIYPSAAQSPPKGARVEDLHGRYVIPGLIDAHVHMTDVEPDMAHYRVFLRSMLDGGVTGVRDMAGNARQLGYLAQLTNSDAIAGPDIFYSALMAGPSFFAKDVRVAAASPNFAAGTAPWMHAVDAKTNLPSLMAQAKGTGATGIKIYANLPAPLVRATTREAHRQGLRVWTHATIFPARPSDAVAAGVDTVSHTAYMVWEAAAKVPDDYSMRAKGDFMHVRPDAPKILALLDSMKIHGTILDATLDVFRDEAEHHPGNVGAGILPWSYQVTRLAHERGIPVDAGTDSSGLPADADGNPDLHALPGIHAEMATLVEHAGFTPIEAIHAATQVSAGAQGQQATRGTIVKGKRADLVVLTADPGKDIHNTTKIDFVMKNGKEYRRGH